MLGVGGGGLRLRLDGLGSRIKQIFVEARFRPIADIRVSTKLEADSPPQ